MGIRPALSIRFPPFRLRSTGPRPTNSSFRSERVNMYPNRVKESFQSSEMHVSVRFRTLPFSPADSTELAHALMFSCAYSNQVLFCPILRRPLGSPAR